MDVPRRGRLLQGSSAPRSGELIDQLAELSGVIIEQILSGAMNEPTDYDQDHDEWVVLLEGAAELEIDGEVFSLTSGDWVLLPAKRSSTSGKWKLLSPHFTELLIDLGQMLCSDRQLTTN